MNGPFPPTEAIAHLLIHVPGDDGSRGLNADSILQRVRAYLPTVYRGERPLIGLEIRDLAGRRLLALAGAGPLIEVALPPGTYHVDAELEGGQRSYTVALEPGATIDLHLRMQRQRH